MITFLWPLAFLALPLPFLVRYLTRPVEPGLSGALRVPFFASVARGGTGRPERAPWWKLLLASLVWALLVTALARPAQVGREIPLPVEGRDIMMAIDLSGSMDEADFAVDGRATTRLGVVKDTADAFIRRRAGDRIGLVLFSDRAYLQAPLTFDRDVVARLLDQAQVGLTGQRTAIGDAIAVSLKRLRDRPNEGRVLILLTDGASNAGAMEPVKAAELARDMGIRVYTIGVGAAQRGFAPSDGPDEALLEQIAQMTGGAYFRATDTGGLVDIYRRIDGLEPVAGEPQHVRPEIALYHWPAGAALLLAALFAALGLLPAPGTARRLSSDPREV